MPNSLVNRISLWSCILVLVLAGVSAGAKPINFRGSKWIWSGDCKYPASSAPAETVYFQRNFEFPAGAKPVSGEVVITCDNYWELYVNGKKLGSNDRNANAWTSPKVINVSENLLIEKNSIAVKGINTFKGPAGLLVKLKVKFENGKEFELVSDAEWMTNSKKVDGWVDTGFIAGDGWKKASVGGKLGCGPWLWEPAAKLRRAQRGIKPKGAAVYEKEKAFTDKVFSDGIVFVRGYIRFVHHDSNNYIQNIRGSRAYFEMDPSTPAAIGRQLVSLVPFKPDGKVTVLCDAKGGFVGSPSVSYDGKTIYFSMVPKGEAYFHVYAIGTDGTNLRQITDGPFHDYDPAELPDGKIVFSSTRIGNREEYHAKYASSLFTCDKDGKDILPLTYHIAADREPRVTSSGSLAFIRMDNFLERAKVETHIHQTRIDGSGGQVIIGPGRTGINYEKDTASEANSRWLRQYGAGSCAVLPDGKITAISQKGVVSSTLATGELLVKGFVPYDMSPLPDSRLLCTSIKRTRFLIFDPKTKEITEALAVNDLDIPDPDPAGMTFGYSDKQVHSVVHLAKRTKPMPRPSMIDPKAARSLNKTGFLNCQNVLNTQHNTADLKRIKAVRLYEGRPFTLEPTKTIYSHIGTEGVELGTVPLASDGSFYVEVPADRPIAMQAVDAEGRPVINEMSWVYVRPGEQRSCIGCHAPVSGAPSSRGVPKALMNRPVKLLGQGQPHRFRANNGANGGVVNLQLDRFRESASINLPGSPDELIKSIKDTNKNIRLSSIRRMGIVRDRRFAPLLCEALSNEKGTEIKCEAALSLSACGDRGSVGALAKTLKTRNPNVRNAVRIALENITGTTSKDMWETPDWDKLESDLIAKLNSKDNQDVILALQSMGHIGGDKSKAAIRKFLTDKPDNELRVLMAAMRSLGYLKDTGAVEQLTGIMNDNLTKKGKGGFHELGIGQKPLTISAAAAEALGRIGNEQAEQAIIEAFGKLAESKVYAFRSGQHSWLMGCHVSQVHYRMLEALDRMESTKAGPLVTKIIESIPADKDRGLLYERDSYEALSARVIARSGELDKVINACVNVLSHVTVKQTSYTKAVSLSPHAQGHIRKYSAQARAAQVLSVVCDDTKYANVVGEFIKGYRAGKDCEKRNWVCFYLIRLLGRIGDEQSGALLVDVLVNEPTETELGLNTPPTHIVYKGWRPFFRPAAAWGLGMLKEDKAVEPLIDAVTNLDNASSTRQQAAIALGRIGDTSIIERLEKIAEDYPEIMTRRSLLESIGRLKITSKSQ